MTIRSGLTGQIGYVAETTWGTAVTVTKFLPIKTIDAEVADLKEKTSELELKWKNEKEVLTGIRADKTELEALKIQADNAEAAADLGTVALTEGSRVRVKVLVKEGTVVPRIAVWAPMS